MLDEAASPLVFTESYSVALTFGYHLAYLGIVEKGMIGETRHLQAEGLRKLLSQRPILSLFPRWEFNASKQKQLRLFSSNYTRLFFG